MCDRTMRKTSGRRGARVLHQRCACRQVQRREAPSDRHNAHHLFDQRFQSSHRPFVHPGQ
uniref:Uncharacterized protein n=1 Tax=Triticum urartu TaxID=4572 RepID=A0A8R7R528_TRIUA